MGGGAGEHAPLFQENMGTLTHTPNFVPYFSPRLIQRRTLALKNEYNYILQGGPGAIAPESQGNVKNGCSSCNDIDSDSC